MDSMRKCMIQLVIIVQCMIYLNVYAIDIKTHCPRMVQNVFDGYAPIGMCVKFLMCYWRALEVFAFVVYFFKQHTYLSLSQVTNPLVFIQTIPMPRTWGLAWPIAANRNTIVMLPLCTIRRATMFAVTAMTYVCH